MKPAGIQKFIDRRFPFGRGGTPMSISEHGGSTSEAGFVVTRYCMRIVVKPLVRKLLVIGLKLGPYLAIELLLPGGSLLALALWVYRSCFRSPS